MSKQAIIYIGVSGSGKSTASKSLKEIGYQIVERDVIREKIISRILPDLDISKANLWSHWKWKHEKEVSEIFDDALSYHSKNGSNIVISDTNLNVKNRSSLVSKLKNLGYEVIFQVIGRDLTLDELWKRNLNRKNVLSHDVIARQYEEFRKEFPLKLQEKRNDLTKAYIFDIDGTLAKMADRSPFDWMAVGQDTPNDAVFFALIGASLMGNKIIIMSGRDSVCRDITKKWLDSHIKTYLTLMCLVEDHDVNYELFMRAENDQRKDTIVKEELYLAHVYGIHNVVAVFDDRPSVCRVWREFGLNVIQVGNPYVEF
jgi:predicted kinase